MQTSKCYKIIMILENLLKERYERFFIDPIEPECQMELLSQYNSLEKWGISANISEEAMVCDYLDEDKNYVFSIIDELYTLVIPDKI